MVSPFPIFARILAIAVLLTLGLWSLATIRFQTELLPLFPRDLASVQILKKAQASVSSESAVIAVARPGTNPGWDAMQKLAEDLRGQPGIGSAEIGMGANHSPSLWLANAIAEMPSDRFSALQNRLTPAAIADRLHVTLDAMSGAIDETEMGRLHFDPLQMETLVFPDPKSNPLATSLALPPVLTIGSSHPLKTFEDDQRFVAEVHAALAVASAQLQPRPDFLLTGQPAFTANISSQMKRDLIVMLSFTIGLISLAFWCTYRSLMPLVWIIVAQLMALLCAAIAGRLIFGELNVMSIGFSSILLGVGMDYCILVYHFFAQEGPVDLAKWRGLRRGIWLSSATTAATFGTLYFSSFPGLRQLAVLVGIGLLATAFFATTFLAGRLAHKRPHAPKWLVPASDRYAHFIGRRRWLLRVVVGIIVIGAVVLFPFVKKYPFYDASIDQLQPTQIEAYQAQQILEQQVGTMPKPAVATGDPAQNRLAWKPLDLAMVKGQFETAGFDSSWSASTLQVFDYLNHWQAGTLNLTGADQANAAWIRLRSELNETAVRDFERLSIFVLLTVVVLCAIAHRSLRLVTLNLSALVLALLMLAGLLVLTRNSMTLVSLLCIPLMIGLVIDYSLHIVLALEHEKGDLVAAFRHLAAPVVLTGLASIIGFSAPMLSSQPALQNFGSVMDLGTLSAVISGLVLLPALYLRLKVSPTETPHQSVTLYRASMFTCGAWLARCLPLALTRFFAGAMGRLYALTHPSGVACVRTNLQLLHASANSRNARNLYSEFGKTLADYFYITTRPPKEAVKIISESAGHHHLEELHRQGKGGVLVTAHLGLFELGGLLMTQNGLPSAVLTLPEPSSGLTRWRTCARKQWNVDTIEVGTDSFAFVQIARRLREGCFVAALIDRPTSHELSPVKLPHGVAHFSSGILLVAMQCRVPVIPSTMVRLSDGTYRAEVFAPILIESKGSRTETLQFYSQQIADTLAPTLCAHSEQWYQFVPLS